MRRANGADATPTRARRATGVLAATLALGALAADAQAAPAPGVAPVIAPVISGVTTHFGQGWPPRLLDRARTLGVGAIRDGISWRTVEPVPGRLAFTPANSGHIDRACHAGLKVLLGLEPRHPLYDQGQTAFSPAAQTAFARYVRAAATRWPDCVIAVEIGNEINGKNGMTGPAAADRIAAHVALLKAVHAAVKPVAPGVALLGGSTNTIATGFLARLFRAGALNHVDGIAVHPYRPAPEGVEHEIARLRAAMARAGGEKPIWATEFSREFARPQDAAPFYLKMAALLESAGVRHHFWYALADQPGFPTMGLVRFDGTPKPAASTFAFAARVLAPHGPAVRVGADDPTLFHFRYGADTHVVWGAPRTIAVEGAAPRFYAADGTALAAPAELGEAPLIVTGAAAVRLGPARVLADSFLGFGQAPLAWFALPRTGAPVPLAPVDWQWTGYLGSSAAPGTVVNPQGIGTTATTVTMVRYRGALTGPLYVSACLVPRPETRGTVLASFVAGGRPLWSARVSAARAVAASVRLAPDAAGPVDLVLRPAGDGATRLAYRFRLSRDAADAAPCPDGA